MQIKDGLLASGNGAFFYDDQTAVRSGANQDGIYVGAPLCAAAAVANIQVLKERNILEHVQEVGPYWLTRMRAELEAIVGEVRGAGILSGEEMTRDPKARVSFEPELQVGARPAASLFEHGVIGRAIPHGDILGFAPPLIITRDEIDIIVDATAKSVDTTYRALKAEAAM